MKLGLVYAEDMTGAVNVAKDATKAGDSLLFSPACASFHMNHNFEHHENTFCDCAKALA